LSDAQAGGAPLGNVGGTHARVPDRAGGHTLGVQSGNARGGPAPDERLGRVVFALLVVGCFAAFVATQRLKHTPTLVQEIEMNTSFSPGSTGTHRLEAISFKLSNADRVTVTVVNAAERDIATLVADRPVGRYRKLSLRWNGREGSPHGYRVLVSPHGYKSLLPNIAGPFAPAGEYHVRVTLIAQKRTIPLNRDFKSIGP
jgi:hypothetical protein